MFRPERGFEEELARQDAYTDALATEAERLRGACERYAVRVMPRPPGFAVEVDLDGVRVVNTDYGGHIAEFGSVNSPPYSPLRRGVAAAGLRLEESQ